MDFQWANKTLAGRRLPSLGPRLAQRPAGFPPCHDIDAANFPDMTGFVSQLLLIGLLLVSSTKYGIVSKNTSL